MTDDKNYILDPLTSLCKLALLYFLPKGTKLGISNHILYIQTYSYHQWIERRLNGDSRRDISNLNAPIIKSIKWYIINNTDKAEIDPETTESIKNIANFSIKGLIKLQEFTYHNDKTIKIILQYFINLLRDAMNDNWSETNIIKIDGENILSDKIKNNFDSRTINAIAKMLIDADKIEKSPEDIIALIDCVHQLLINRDNLFIKLMKDVNTTL